MLVILRLGLGFHFLYEGVWKIKNAAIFSAEPFLTEAKGPAAPLFYAMIDDIDGRGRLVTKDAKTGKYEVDGKRFVETWKAYQGRFAEYYRLSEQQIKETQDICGRFEASLNEYLKDNEAEIFGHFESLDRFEEQRRAGGNDAPYYRKRTWDRQQELRKEANAWIAHLDGLGKEYRQALFEKLEPKQRELGVMGASWNPLSWTRGEQINFAVTYGLTAIGLCLMVGFCTRLACLGGAAFMFFVALTQPSWPLIYPPAPPVVGHALLVNKDVVEMLALLALATTPVGSWAGLDVFVHQWIVCPIVSAFSSNETKKGV